MVFYFESNFLFISIQKCGKNLGNIKNQNSIYLSYSERREVPHFLDCRRKFIQFWGRRALHGTQLSGGVGNPEEKERVAGHTCLPGLCEPQIHSDYLAT